MALDATVGGTASDSYVSVTEANQFFVSHWSTAKATAWSALTTPQKESVLKQSTRLIESCRFLDDELGSGVLPEALETLDQYSTVITRQFVGQTLSFPRNVDLNTVDAAIVPQDVKDAQCEQAVFLLTADDSVLLNQLQGVTEEAASAGGARIYQHYAGGMGSLIAPMAYELLKKFFRPTKRFRRA